jgi:hypothetical protein
MRPNDQSKIGANHYMLSFFLQKLRIGMPQFGCDPAHSQSFCAES